MELKLRSRYQGYPKEIAKRLKIHSLIVAFYRKFYTHIIKTKKIAVEGIQAKFYISSEKNFGTFVGRYDQSQSKDSVNATGEIAFHKDAINNIKSSDTFFDIGAAEGLYTCFVGQIVGDQSVVAFEPRPETFQHLKKNVDMNNINAHLFNIVLMDKEKDVEFLEDGMKISSDKNTNDTFTVPANTGDALVEEESLPQPTIVKIDVEGAELNVISGLERTLSHRACRLVYLEIHPEYLSQYGQTARMVREKMQSLGFQQVREYGNPETRVVYESADMQ